MLGSPNRLIRDFLKFFSLPYWLKLQQKYVSKKEKTGKFKISRIGRLSDPSIGFEKNVFAAKKSFKTLAYFSYCRKHLKRENW